MPLAQPFTGLLYDPGVSGPMEAVTTPPYDVISAEEQDRFYRASPYNIIRAVLGKNEPGDDEEHSKYTRAGAYLRAWREQGALTPTAEPSVYPYAFDFHFGGRPRRVRGVIVALQMEPWGGSIVPHERTLAGPIEDRLRLLRAVQANLSPIYAVFEGPSPELARFLDEVTSAPPARHLTDEDGTRHALWVAPQAADLVAGVLRDQQLLIADGHHRYTVALAHRDQMRAESGPGPWDFMMALIVDAGTEEPPVLPIHRLLLNGGDSMPTPDGEQVRDMAEVLASLGDERLTFGTVVLEDGKLVHRVARLDGPPPTVCALHDRVLDRIPDAQLRFEPDSVAAEAAVLAGTASIAYLLPPTRVERVWEVVRTSRRLPVKSTYFWPKPRTGMLIRPLDA
jgi:uncharacterized protein (DUF1015 family)